MLLFEYDAKELLAVQGIPVPGGIRLNYVQQPTDSPTQERSGPWIVKPQLLGGARDMTRYVATATTSEEIRDAATRLLEATIDGQPVHSVLVERQFTPAGNAFLRFECDPPSAGVRITLAADAPADGLPDPAGPTTVVAPEPNAVIDGVEALVDALPGEAGVCVGEAGRMLAPLFFGYEATLLEISPLMLLSDGRWAVGDVRLAIDEGALFRHPELLSLIERRNVAYGDVRLRRRYGIDYRVIDPEGAVATLTAGCGYGAFLVDELNAEGLSAYNVMDASSTALNDSDETLDYLIDSFCAATAARCLLVAVAGDLVDLPAFARRFAAALGRRPDFKLPVVARFIGSGAGAAGAILEQAAPATDVEPALETAIERTAGQLAERSR